MDHGKQMDTGGGLSRKRLVKSESKRRSNHQNPESQEIVSNQEECSGDRLKMCENPQSSGHNN